MKTVISRIKGIINSFRYFLKVKPKGIVLEEKTGNVLKVGP